MRDRATKILQEHKSIHYFVCNAKCIKTSKLIRELDIDSLEQEILKFSSDMRIHIMVDRYDTVEMSKNNEPMNHKVLRIELIHKKIHKKFKDRFFIDVVTHEKNNNWFVHRVISRMIRGRH